MLPRVGGEPLAPPIVEDNVVTGYFHFLRTEFRPVEACQLAGRTIVWLSGRLIATVGRLLPAQEVEEGGVVVQIPSGAAPSPPLPSDLEERYATLLADVVESWLKAADGLDETEGFAELVGEIAAKQLAQMPQEILAWLEATGGARALGAELEPIGLRLAQQFDAGCIWRIRRALIMRIHLYFAEAFKAVSDLDMEIEGDQEAAIMARLDICPEHRSYLVSRLEQDLYFTLCSADHVEELRARAVAPVLAELTAQVAVSAIEGMVSEESLATGFFALIEMIAAGFPDMDDPAELMTDEEQQALISALCIFLDKGCRTKGTFLAKMKKGTVIGLIHWALEQVLIKDEAGKQRVRLGALSPMFKAPPSPSRVEEVEHFLSPSGPKNFYWKLAQRLTKFHDGTTWLYKMSKTYPRIWTNLLHHCLHDVLDEIFLVWDTPPHVEDL